MIQSMTGYGKAVTEFNGGKVHAEIKSLNSKAMDLSTRVAPIFREKEMEVRQRVASALERGKVELNLWIEKDATADASTINADIVAAYLDQMKAIATAQGLSMPADPLAVVLRMPDVFTRTETEELTAELWQIASDTLDGALKALTAFRIQEGEALKKKFEEKIHNIAALLADIEPFEKSRVEKIRQRITDGLQQIKGADYDQGRLEQEMIFYIEKLDINEEKQRLANHLRYFQTTLDDGHGQGKKLGFIAQEMGREINTTGSKSNQAEMQNIVVKMKDELEQIKEQVLNVL